jgi:TolB-like protein/Flp pilus assembly protein TadD
VSYQRFFAELKRRKVFQVAALYGIVAFVVLQVADLVLPTLGIPEWGMRLILVLILFGFPIALVLAWAFETTPDGVRRTGQADTGEITQIVSMPASSRWPSGIAALVGLLLLVSGAWWVGRRSAGAADATGNGDGPTSVASPAADRSIAVLPFENMASDAEGESFVSGIHDDILTQLSKIEALHVTSRTSVREYANTEKSVGEIAAELGVANILEGGVQRSGDRVRINIQLIDAATDRHLWAETYNRELTAENVFEIQGDIARAVATALEAELSAEEEDQLGLVQTRSLEALDALNRGRELQANPSEQTDRAAVAQFRRAVELDPDFKAAWAELVRAQSWLLREGYEFDTIPARQSLDRLRELAPGAPETYLAAGNYAYYALGDYERAVRELREAERLDPNNEEVVRSLGWVLRRLGRIGEALEYGHRALEASPRDVSQIWNLGDTYGSLRRFDAARDLFETALDLRPDAETIFMFYFGSTLWSAGDTVKARQLIETFGPLMDGAIRSMIETDLALAHRDLETAIDRLEAAAPYKADPRLRLPQATGASWSYYRPIYLSKLYRFARDSAKSRAWADSAISEAAAALEVRPQPAPFDLFGRRASAHAMLGLGYALRGDSAAAVREGEKAVELYPPEYDAVNGTRTVGFLAEILTLVGGYDRAMDEIERLSTLYSYFGPARLRLDPLYDPLRGNPRFEALVEKDWTLPLNHTNPP